MSDLVHRAEVGYATFVHSGSGDIHLEGSSFVPTPTSPANGCNLPHRHPNFVGRDEEISKLIEAISSRAWIVTVDGLGGMGKTTLALEIAHLCRDRGPQFPTLPKVYWVRMDIRTWSA